MIVISDTTPIVSLIKISRIDLLDEVVTKLSNMQPLEAKNHDHELAGIYKGFRECHIQPDWLLIYRINNNDLILFLSRTGTHSDLF